MDNLYCAALNEDSLTVPVEGDLSRHLTALRLRDGEGVRVLNGRGLVATCRVDRTRTAPVLTVVGRELHVTTQPEITVALGILDHRDRFEMAIEKLTELGVARIVPLSCDHAQHMRTSHERLVAKAIAAITQSGNPFLPVIEMPTSLDQVDFNSDLVIVGDAEGGDCHADAEIVRQARRIVVIVGPEGGLSTREMLILRDNASTRRWRIGSLRLRAETAAIAIASVVRSMK